MEGKQGLWAAPGHGRGHLPLRVCVALAKLGRAAAGALKADGGAQQAECPPLEPFLGARGLLLTPPSMGPMPGSPEGGTCIIAWPCSWALALDGQTNRRGSGHRVASEVPEGVQPRERVQREFSPGSLCTCVKGACRRTGTPGLGDKSPGAPLVWSCCLSLSAALVGRCPLAGWAETPVRQAHIHLQGGTPHPADSWVTLLGRGSSIWPSGNLASGLSMKDGMRLKAPPWPPSLEAPCGAYLQGGGRVFQELLGTVLLRLKSVQVLHRYFNALPIVGYSPGRDPRSKPDRSRPPCAPGPLARQAVTGPHRAHQGSTRGLVWRGMPDQSGDPAGISPGPPPRQRPCRPRGASLGSRPHSPCSLSAHGGSQMTPEGGPASMEASESTRVSLSPAGAW